MKVLGRKILERPIHLSSGDSLEVTWCDEQHGETVLCQHTITAAEAMVVDEAVLFETIFEDRRALGGLFLEHKK